jgi:hypothetical protein
MKENSSPSSFASTGMTPAEAITAQVEIYQKASRACGHKLLSIYTDLGLNHDEQHKGINDVAVQACQTWTEAVEDAESKRTALRLKIDECYKESQKMKCQLGDNVLEDDCQSLIVRCNITVCSLRVSLTEVSSQLSPSSPKRSLYTLYQEEKAKLEVWRTKRAERFEEYSKRQVSIAGKAPISAQQHRHRSLPLAPPTPTLPSQGDVNRLKTQLGLHVVPATRQPDISRTNMEYLQLEFEKLTDTKVQQRHAQCTATISLQRFLGPVRPSSPCLTRCLTFQRSSATLHRLLTGLRQRPPTRTRRPRSWRSWGSCWCSWTRAAPSSRRRQI